MVLFSAGEEIARGAYPSMVHTAISRVHRVRIATVLAMSYLPAEPNSQPAFALDTLSTAAQFDAPERQVLREAPGRST
jgi:hypothetical protein